MPPKGLNTNSNRQPHPDVFIKGKGAAAGQAGMQSGLISRQHQVQPGGLIQQPKATVSAQNLTASQGYRDAAAAMGAQTAQSSQLSKEQQILLMKKIQQNQMQQQMGQSQTTGQTHVTSQQQYLAQQKMLLKMGVPQSSQNNGYARNAGKQAVSNTAPASHQQTSVMQRQQQPRDPQM